MCTVSNLRAAAVGLLLAGAASGAYAQDFERVAPKLPPAEAQPDLVLPASQPAAQASTAPITPALKGLVFVTDLDKLVADGVAPPAGGLDLSQVPVLDHPELRAQLQPYLNRPLSLADIEQIRAAASAWMRRQGRPFVDISAPRQNITSGVLQLVVTQYRLGEVKVEGARYFSPDLIERTSGLEPGQSLSVAQLEADLDRLNQNPFLNVDAVFKPGASPGETDVVLAARDRLPLRLYAGYDNLGVRTLGREQYNLGINWGNVFGTGQIASYQYTRSFTGRFTSHSASDVIPLPRGQRLFVFGSYGTARPQTPSIFRNEGHSGQASARYVIPLSRGQGRSQNLQLGYDYKTTDNNLEFAGIQVFAVRAELNQFPVIYDITQRDRFGQTSFQNLLVYSPGNLTDNNTTAALSTLVPGAKANYVYDRVLVTRTNRLPKQMSSITRLTFQWASDNLPNSEQLGGGGPGSVRGYYTDTALGSEGVLFSQEVRLAPFSPSARLGGNGDLGDRAQLGVFFDYASLDQVRLLPGLSETELASAGFTARYSISRFLDVQFDLGWRLRETPTAPQKGSYGAFAITAGF